jgi:hypothetical protein
VPAFDCIGWNWYVKWSLLTIGVPAFGLACVGLRYMWQRRTEPTQAKKKAVALGFLVIMVLYPQVSERIFTALRCRKLGDSLSLLEADYTIGCADVWHTRVRVLALLLVLVWPFGIPGLTLWLMWRQWRISRFLWAEKEAADADAAPPAAAQAPPAPLTPSREPSDLRLSLIAGTPSRRSDGASASAQVTDSSTLTQYHFARIQPTFGFCTKEYRPAVFWFEPIDMFRESPNPAPHCLSLCTPGFRVLNCN